MTPSDTLYARACAVMPAGVNSPVRAFRSVGGTPRFFAHARGATVHTEDGDDLVDFCMSWGPLILGHGHPDVLAAVHSAVDRGLSYGACHAGEVELCERILRGFPWADEARLVSSGTEAVMTAIRLARGATGRDRIIKFSGGYHGHVDAMLVKAGSGLVTQGIASSAGVTEASAADTLVAPFDDLDAVTALFDAHPGEIAAVFLEPMPANNGLLIQRPTFLKALRELCTARGALLVFDEVISGFRLKYGGYGDLVGVTPDLVTLGKIVGGGMPTGAVVAPRALMDQLAPLGPVYQAGTLSGNPISTAAGCATLDVLSDPAVYTRLEALGARLEARLAAANLPGLQIQRQGSIVWPYLSTQPAPRNAEDLDPEAATRFATVHARLLAAGYYVPPSAYEVLFVSAAHTEAHIDGLADAMIAAIA